MENSDIVSNFSLDIFSEFHVTDEEIINCLETVEKKQENAINSTNMPEKAIEKRENTRFALLTDEDLTTIISSAEAKGSKKNTKWIVGTIEGKYNFKTKLL